ncbi:MAG: hypothetical protein IJ760_04125 [Bacteroidales bacterium]|nr:hypothetical protein [Bacteroidales bacterium]
MNTLNFTIKAKTVDSYLYGGYLFLLMEDGRILYVSYHRMIHMLCAKYPQFERLIKLAFLHNEYFKSKSVQLILGIEELKNAVKDLWNKAAKEVVFEVDFNDIEEYCHSMGTWNSLPLDVYMYDLRMYIASKEGVMESRLNPDFNDKYYRLRPTRFEKCFDSKVVSLSARAGKVVLSADREGLFYADALVENQRVRVSDNSNVPGRSLRTGWSDFDVINYESARQFRYLANETANTDRLSSDRFRFGDKIERKEITSFATATFEMADMMEHASIDKEQIRFCFNSKGRSFFVMNDGSFVNIKIKKTDDAPIKYSSVSRQLPQLGNSGGVASPLKAAIVPNGCVVEFFDKVVLYQSGEAQVLEHNPVYSIRTYMGSRNYTDIVTVTKEDAVSFHSVDVFNTINSTRMFPV